MPTAAQHNPFRVERLRTLVYQPLSDDVDALMDRLASQGYRTCILGPHGTGKSTLMRALRHRLEATGTTTHWLQLHFDQRAPWTLALARQLRRVPREHIWFIDGADHLPWWSWQLARYITRHHAGLIVTSHDRPLLPVLIQTHTTRTLAHDLVRQLCADRKLVPDALIDQCFHEHAGNIREVLRSLYDHCATA